MLPESPVQPECLSDKKIISNKENTEKKIGIVIAVMSEDLGEVKKKLSVLFINTEN